MATLRFAQQDVSRRAAEPRSRGEKLRKKITCHPRESGDPAPAIAKRLARWRRSCDTSAGKLLGSRFRGNDNVFLTAEGAQNRSAALRLCVIPFGGSCA